MEIEPSDQPEPVLQPEAGENEQKAWEIEKAQFEQENFTLNQELADTRAKLQDIHSANKHMHEEVARNVNELAECTNQRRLLETARNELTEKNINLESAVARLKIEKEERDNALVNSNREKQTISAEFFALREQIQQLSDEKANLVVSNETLKRENLSIAFEREKYANEKQMYNDSKAWFIKEIEERDSKVSTLRLELSNKDMELTNERVQLDYQANNWKMQIDELTEKLEMTKKQNADLLRRLDEVEKQCAEEVASLDKERRVQDQLILVLKKSVEEYELAANSAKDQLSSREVVVTEVREQLVELQELIQNDKQAYAEQLKEKEREVSKLKVELDKAHELLKSKHAVNVNVTEAELAALSPAAADTARLLKGGQTLTGFVREQARLAGELAAQKEENIQLMETLQELVDTLEGDKANLTTQKNLTDSVFDKNERYEHQLKEAEHERTSLLNQRDSAQRELAFTQAELEKYQRDFELIMKRNAELMYAIERQNLSESDDASDEKLFTTIVSLQQRNVQLESDIEHEKASAAQAAMNAQNVEMAELRCELTKAHDSETRFKSQIEQLKTALHVAKDQAEHFKELVRDSVSAAEARNARIKAQEAVADKMAAEMRVARLEDRIKMMKEERERREVETAERIEAAENFANETKTNYVTANCMLETQKMLTAELQKEIGRYENDAEQAKANLAKMVAEDAKKSQKLSEFGAQLMDAKEQVGSMSVRIRSLEDELASALSQVTYLRMENDSHQAIMQREQQFAISFNEVTARLARVEDEKLNALKNQNDVVQMERDSLKASAARLSDQLIHIKNEAKLVQQRMEKEMQALKQRLAEKTEQNSYHEKELLDLRSKLASVQAQYIGADTSGMTPDRLKKEYQQMKNRNQFLQNQLDDVSKQLLEAKTEKTKRDDESALVESHSNVLEDNLKQAEIMSNYERERLEAKVKTFEERSQELSDTLAKVREEFEFTKMELDETSSRYEQENAELRRQLDVVRLEVDGAQVTKEEAAATVEKAKAEVQQKEEEVKEMTEKMTALNERLNATEIQVARLQTQFDEKTLALVAETDAKNQADQLRIAAEHALARKVEEHALQEEKSSATMKAYSEKLEQLTRQYETIATSSATSEADLSAADLSIQSDTSQTALVSSLQNMLQFVRNDKDNAIARAMNAEIEMKRLRAETAVYEAGRNELLAKIRDMETERSANAGALVERAKLLEKVETLSSVQKLNAQLTAEKNQLSTNYTQAMQSKNETDRKLAAVSSKLNDTNMKLSTANQELTQKRKEVDTLKQRLESGGRAQNSALQTQLEQAKALLAQSRQETTLAASQTEDANKAKVAAEENAKVYMSKFNQTRQLALRYRDDLNALKAAATEGSSIQLTTENEKLKQEIETAKKDIEALEKKVSEAEMSTYRMTMLESRCAALNEKWMEVTQERDNLMQTNMKLAREMSSSRSAAATDVETKPTISTPASAEPAKQTPTARVAKLQNVITPSPFSPSNAPPLASSTPKVEVSSNDQTEPDQTSASSSVAGSAKKPGFFVALSQPTVPTQKTPTSQSQIPPAPASSKSATSTPFSSVIPPTIPGEPTEVIPPVPSETVPDPTPPANVFGKSVLPVPQLFQTSSARVPTQSLFSSSSSSSSSAPPPGPSTAVVPDVVKEKKTVLPNIEAGASSSSHPSNVTYSFATSTILGTQPGQKLFGMSSTPELNISACSAESDNMVLPEESESVAEAAAEQSSHVSGSVDDANKTIEADLATNDGESRDSTLVTGVSSSDGRRKRAANECDSNEPKRQRESPSEAVTSSETRQQGGNAAADVPELDDDAVLDIEQEVSDEDPNEITIRQREPAVLENDEEVLVDDMEPEEEEEEEDDDSFGNDEEYEDEQDDSRDAPAARPQSGDVIVLSDDDDDNDMGVNVIEEDEDDADTLNDLDDEEEEEEDDDEDPIDVDGNGGNDRDVEEVVENDGGVEVIGGEDSQPSIDDQDREAASAMEEAEDEGREPLAPVDEAVAPADPTGASGIGSSAASQPDVPRLRMPPGILREEREDQCSSSNETNEGPTRSSPMTARNMARMSRPTRGGRTPARGIYQPRRGGAGGGAPGRGGGVGGGSGSGSSA